MEQKQMRRLKPNAMDIGKIPPQAIELEESIIGAIMLEKEAYYKVVEYFQPDIFYKEAHELIAHSIIRLHNNSEPCDILTVTLDMKKHGTLDLAGGAYYITQLTGRVASSANIEFHMKLLMQFYVKREVIRSATIMMSEAYEENTDVFDVIDNAGKTITGLTNRIITNKITPIHSLYNEGMKYNEELISKKGMAGIPSGFQVMDRITGGWQKSDLIIVAARPGMGKTSLVLNYARNAAVMYNVPTAIFSLEMSKLQLMARLQSNETGEPLEKFLREGLDELEQQVVMAQCNDLINSPLFIDDTPSLTVFEFKNKVRKLKRENKIELVCIDYLQLMSGGGKFHSREDEVSYISRSIKGLAKELNIPIIALAQLSRAVEGRGGEKTPVLSDLRDSGAIEQDADMVIFIHRPEYYGINLDENNQLTAGKAQAIIAKHRNGSTDKVKMGWEGKCTRFIDVGESFESYLNEPKNKYAPNPNKFTEPKKEDLPF